KREGFTMPLLIGGATTSAKHTTVRIAPAYSGPGGFVKDAPRRVPAGEKLARGEVRDDFVREVRVHQEKEREAYSKRRQRKLVTYAEARKKKFEIDWSARPVPVPGFVGTKAFNDFPLEQIVPYIDWSPFFMAWELAGKYPHI